MCDHLKSHLGQDKYFPNATYSNLEDLFENIYDLGTDFKNSLFIFYYRVLACLSFFFWLLLFYLWVVREDVVFFYVVGSF